MKELTIESCGICCQLSGTETASQKYRSNYPDTNLPEASEKLVIVKDFKPLSERKLQLRQCPECGRYYLYTTDYDYDAYGSEDDQELTRLTDEEAVEYLNKTE